MTTKIFHMELYPLKFKPILKDRIWGGNKLNTILGKEKTKSVVGESWELSGVDGDQSVVANGFLKGNTLEEIIEIYMGELVGDAIYENYGTTFPLLFKFIDATDVLSIQVHPDDTLAMERHQAFGKTEMWYILEAEPESEIIVGFKETTNAEAYTKHLNESKLVQLLNIEKAQSGDVFYIPAGRVHAIGKGILLAEIQQTSDTTYRIYDWDRVDAKGKARDLHTEWALDAINYHCEAPYKTAYTSRVNDAVNLVDCDFFTTNLIELTQSIENNYTMLDSFVVLMCVEGSVFIKMSNGTEEKLSKGETVLIPSVAELVQLIAITPSKLIEVYMK